MIDADPRATPPLARFRAAGRVLVLVALVAGLVVAWQYRGALHPAAISTTIAQHPAAPLIFLLAHIAASLLFIPRTALAVAAGLMFGMVMGLVWATLGSVVGATAGFLVARYVNAGLIDPEAIPRLGPLLVRCEREGWRAVVAVRLIPVVPHSLANYALGLTRLSLGDYAFGSLLGQLPMTVAYVELGAAGEDVMAGKAGWLVPTAVGLVALALSLFLPRLLKRRTAN
jgi:uncharacterized membrane protein YdjX (TVP38/TMEM64 family)